MEIDLTKDAREWQRIARDYADNYLQPHEVEAELNDGVLPDGGLFLYSSQSGYRRPEEPWRARIADGMPGCNLGTTWPRNQRPVLVFPGSAVMDV